ncbi:MAG: hypothetical protein DRJ07_04870 [Bacteroidetes bacterium]|nr:MAG: hypothetical protein DRJ07_04870 [Bacteroidota bacterium]
MYHPSLGTLNFKKMRKFVFFLMILGFISCESEIEIAIKDSESQIVIEANVSTLIKASKVKITKSLNLNDPLPYPAVSNALVTITDYSTDEVFILSEAESGIYENPNLIGFDEHNYTLDVIIGEETYTSNSTIPQRVVLESLIQIGEASDSDKHDGPGGRPNNSSDNDIAEIIPLYNDPIEFTNYYQFIVTRNDTILSDVFIQSDYAFNGLENSKSLKIEANKNDILYIDMQCIDEAVYDYLLGLSKNINQSSATPTNPVSNISNNALGYFKAQTSSKKMISVK